MRGRGAGDGGIEAGIVSDFIATAAAVVLVSVWKSAKFSPVGGRGADDGGIEADIVSTIATVAAVALVSA